MAAAASERLTNANNFSEPLSGNLASKAFDGRYTESGSSELIRIGAHFARRKTKDGLRRWCIVAVNRCFHGGLPRGEQSMNRNLFT